MNDIIFPKPASSALLIVDVQERLAPAMVDGSSQLLKATRVLIECAAEFQWPILYTEQYPRGLGATVSALLPRLQELGARRIEKVEFSCLRNAEFAEQVQPTLPNHVVVCGMESHICVLQTVADLQARGHQAFVPLDGVASRTLENRDNGLRLMERTGAIVTNSETLLFAALQKAGTDAFKRLSPLIR